MVEGTGAGAMFRRLPAFALHLHAALFRLPPAALAVIAFLAVGLPFALWMMPTGPAYVPLFKMVKDRADVAGIAGKLEQHKIPCVLADGGRTVLVPAASLEEAWMQLAQDGLIPRQFEHDREDFFGQGSAADLTPDAQRLRRQRALEAELSRTITDFEGVESARVHVTERSETLFRSEQRDPTASVVLGLAMNYKLTAGEVRSIIQVVCHSVPGLQSENVTIADRCGTEYQASGPSEPTTSAMDLALGQYAEKDIVAKMQSHLWPIFGAENCAISATVEVHSPRVDQAEEAAAPASLEEVGAAGGVLAALNVGTVSRPDFAGRRRVTRSRACLRLADAGGAIFVRRLSLSVLLNSRSLPGGRLIASLRESLTEDLKAAVGFDAGRGDTLSLVAAPFRTQAVTGDAAQEPLALGSVLVRHFNMFWIGQIAVLLWILTCILRGSSGVEPASPLCPVTVAQALGRRACKTAWSEKGVAKLAGADLARAAAAASDADLALALRGISQSQGERILATLDPARAAAIRSRVARHEPVLLGHVEQSIVKLMAAAGRKDGGSNA